MNRLTMLSLALAGSVCGMASAQEPATGGGAPTLTTYENPDLHYALTLPDGWERIPQETVQQNADRIAEQTGTPPQQFIAGFQRHAKGWFHHPYILIMHRPAVGDTHLATVANGVRQEIEKVNAHGDADLNRIAAKSPFGFGEPSIDLKRTLILVPTTQELPKVGKVRGLMALKPGKDGTVQLNFYARADRFDADEGDFEFVLNKMQFSPGHEWVELSDLEREDRQNWAGLGKAIGGVVGLLAAAVLAVFGARRLTRPKAPQGEAAAEAAARRSLEVAERGEEILAVAEQVSLVERLRSSGDLYFTSHRLVFVKTGERTSSAALAFGLIGAGVAAAASRRNSKELTTRPLGEIIARAAPEHVLDYSALASVVVRLYRVQTSTVIVEPRGAKRLKFYSRRNALLPIAEALAKIQARGAPLQLAGA